MKISDSLGNLYTHTMFKKKTYEMKDDADEITVSNAIPTKHHGGHSSHHKHHKSQYSHFKPDFCLSAQKQNMTSMY